MTRTISLVLGLLLLPGTLSAQPSMFEVIPKDASAAIVLRSIHDFKVKGTKLLRDLEMQDPDAVDKIIPLALNYLQIGGGVDEKAPVVLAMLDDRDLNPENVVLKIPIADRDRILAGFKFEKNPKDGEIVAIKGEGFIAPRALVIRGKYLCLGLSETPLKRLTDQALEASAVEKKQFADSDLLVYLGKRTWPFVWGGYLTSLDRYFSNRKDEEERKVGRQFVKGMQAAQHSFIGVRVKDGVRLRSNVVFDAKNEKAAREMLDILRAGTSKSSVAGLPDGRAMAALAWKADGSKNGILAKLFFDVFLEGPLPGVFNNLPVFANTDYPSVVGVTHELSQRLKGVRVGLYHNLNEKELGLFSAVAIFDTDDGPAFLKEIRTLTKIANLSADDLKLATTKDLIDLDKLTRDLNNVNFNVRQSATTRLLLVGQPALPYLQNVLDKPLTLEQKRRAEGIKQQIDAAAEQGRKDLLMPKEMPKRLRASFAIAPEVEKRDGVAIDVLKLTFNTKNADFHKYVAQLLGPNWDKLRLAVVGNQVIVAAGSDVAFLDQTIANLKNGKPGLDASKALAGFEKGADKGRAIEMHGSAQGFLGLLAKEWKLPQKLFRDPPELTSFSIGFESDRLHLDLWVPTRELRTMVQAVMPGQ
ncbi:MAG: hypothetical protein HY289_05350 [Planctomycetes bacterium]|nr:hypothetical protein [Planctomycetota bacterium]